MRPLVMMDRRRPEHPKLREAPGARCRQAPGTISRLALAALAATESLAVATAMTGQLVTRDTCGAGV